MKIEPAQSFFRVSYNWKEKNKKGFLISHEKPTAFNHPPALSFTLVRGITGYGRVSVILPSLAGVDVYGLSLCVISNRKLYSISLVARNAS